MNANYKEIYENWCTNPYFDEETKKELRAIEGNEKEIQERFCRTLEFGTGGLRGVIAAGTNRMNIYTVRQATQGLANYIILQKGQKKGVAIAYDSRIMSPEFAKEAALCLNANGISTYLFDNLRPTPELSFCVRYLGCIAGIVITASHNPREYNGYKVYWEDGAQITAPHDQNIMNEVEKVTDITLTKTMEVIDAIQNGLYKIIGNEMDALYMEQLKKQIIHPDMIKEAAKDIKVVYTPLHGAGNLLVSQGLRELGFEHVYVVKEQESPDGTFPTVSYPNPEDKAAWNLALLLAKKVDADLVLATDPDADRMGVYVKDSVTKEYINFTGNMSGMVIAEYILKERTQNSTLPNNPALVKTIVTTNMAKAIAKEYNVTLIEVLTGFKYIGEQIRLFEEKQNYSYVFGLEESYGSLAGTYARDKDACVAAMLVCEAAAFYRRQGKTLWDVMNDMYKKYGYYKEELETITLKGIDGNQKIRDIMERQRKNPPKTIGGFEVQTIRDYLTGQINNLKTGETIKTELPVSDVLYYELEDQAWYCIRPSGTEPKIKFYFGVKSHSLEESKQMLKRLKKETGNNN